MEITKRQLVSSANALDTFLASADIKHGRCAYRLTRNLKVLGEAHRQYIAERQEIVDSFKVLGDDGAPKMLPPDEEGGKPRFEFKENAEQDMQDELDDLLDRSIDVDLWKIPVEWMDGIENANTLPLFYNADFMFEDKP